LAVARRRLVPEAAIAGAERHELRLLAVVAQMVEEGPPVTRAEGLGRQIRTREAGITLLAAQHVDVLAVDALAAHHEPAVVARRTGREHAPSLVKAQGDADPTHALRQGELVAGHAGEVPG